MDPFFEPEHVQLRNHVRSWVDHHLISRKKIVPDVDVEARDLLTHLGREGFVGYTVPKKGGVMVIRGVLLTIEMSSLNCAGAPRGGV